MDKFKTQLADEEIVLDDDKAAKKKDKKKKKRVAEEEEEDAAAGEGWSRCWGFAGSRQADCICSQRQHSSIGSSRMQCLKWRAVAATPLACLHIGCACIEPTVHLC
jgi:hypothetical protein